MIFKVETNKNENRPRHLHGTLGLRGYTISDQCALFSTKKITLKIYKRHLLFGSLSLENTKN